MIPVKKQTKRKIAGVSGETFRTRKLFISELTYEQPVKNVVIRYWIQGLCVKYNEETFFLDDGSAVVEVHGNHVPGYTDMIPPLAKYFMCIVVLDKISAPSMLFFS